MIKFVVPTYEFLMGGDKLAGTDSDIAIRTSVACRR
jgi:hypothetical protein